MDDNTEFNRLYWHSRRGMLELDVLLIPFLEEVYRDLPKQDQDLYRKLLTCEDADIWQWFMQRSQPDDPELQRIVDMIVQRVQPD
ncbi:succinate dehydrogenase assembly factor 2 [Marinobacter caseinilyticus]|uniref:FAD assembly factor SdhE n=1 Tax=Marinobacter caseinilyticus TaxID=2692195 RepID=UPI00140E0FEA|nr:succinate dehydrogenase assembly factor 2 [Marinobacter caseinilyticus]